MFPRTKTAWHNEFFWPSVCQEIPQKHGRLLKFVKGQLNWRSWKTVKGYWKSHRKSWNLTNSKVYEPCFINKFRRKRIGILATQRWRKSLPKFNTPETKQQLTKLATEITLECGMTEINFGENGIMYHGRGLPLNVKSENLNSIFQVKSHIKKTVNLGNKSQWQKLVSKLKGLKQISISKPQKLFWILTLDFDQPPTFLPYQSGRPGSIVWQFVKLPCTYNSHLDRTMDKTWKILCPNIRQ